MGKSKEPYSVIPSTPTDFKTACQVVAHSIMALAYWNERIRRIDKFSSEYKRARKLHHLWREAKREAEKHIETYQLRMF